MIDFFHLFITCVIGLNKLIKNTNFNNFFKTLKTKEEKLGHK